MAKNNHLAFIFAGEEQRAPGSFYGPIMRNEYVLHYILRGEGFVKCGGKTIKVSEGQSFILFPNELAKYYADIVNPWHYTWVNFAGDEADSIIAQTAFSPTNRVAPARPLYEVYPLYEDAVSAYYMPSEPMKNAKLHLLLAHYTQFFPADKQEVEKSTADAVIEFMQNNYMFENMNVETIASRLNISRSQLFRICKNSRGCSPIQYLTDLRIKQAMMWLETTDHPVSSIAGSVGISDAMYFSRLFTEKTGLSPTEYRKKFRN